MTPLLSIQNINKQYRVGKGTVHALKDFSLDIHQGEVFGLAGESGCGKTTLGKIVTRLTAPDSGRLMFKGRDLLAMGSQELRATRRQLQIVLQDPYGSLNPRLTVGEIIGEGLRIQGIKLANQVEEILEAVNLHSCMKVRYPHTLSGGQRQRVNIARALVLKPEFLVLDESVSALDVSHQRQVIELLKTLQKQYNLTYLFISHDLAVLRALSHRIGFMQNGRLISVSQ